MRRSRQGNGSELAKRVRGFSVSPTVAMAQKAAARRERGLGVIDMTVGEPDLPTPEHVVAAAEDALRQGRTHYTASAGLGELRAAVAYRYREDYGLDLDVEETLISCGGKHALYLACQALFDRGDEVVVASPHWPSFEQAVRLAGARAVLVQTKESEGFQVRARSLARAVGPRTKALILNSPANPTSVVIEERELGAIAQLARRRDLFVLYDDAYARLIYNTTPPAALRMLRSELGERLVVLGTASKTYCMTGWRIGWILGPKTLVSACSALASHSTQCPTTFAQIGAIRALLGPQESVRAMADEYQRRRDVTLPVVRAIPGVTCVEPTGGFYLFPNVARHSGTGTGASVALAHRMLEQTGVGVVPGEAFGAPGHVRISFARPVVELLDGLARMTAFLSEGPTR